MGLRLRNSIRGARVGMLFSRVVLVVALRSLDHPRGGRTGTALGVAHAVAAFLQLDQPMQAAGEEACDLSLIHI